MENPRDTNIGHNALADIKSLNNSPIYEFVNKKTEKLVTALYMVTDCMETEDALKGKLRFLGVELLSDMYKLSNLSMIEKHTHLGISVSRISEILSFVDIACTIGFISEMNANILKREFNSLISELRSHLSQKQSLSFVLDEKMLEVPRPIEEINKGPAYRTGTGRHFSIGHSIGQYKGQIKDSPMTFNTKDKQVNQQSKQERTEKIMSLIKEKIEVSIKDISVEFTDCSEKTIQRELNDLVLKGKLTKKGEKRWSRYLVVSSN